METRRIATIGLLGAIAIVLGATQLGFIPIPNMTGRATIMHVPVILAAILEGPVAGALTGLIFGVYSFLTPSGAIPPDPIVRILPRVLIGITSWYAYRLFWKKPLVGAAMAGIVGTLTNTIGFVGLAILMGYIPLAATVAILPAAIAELILATVIVCAVARALKGRMRRK